MGVSIRHHVLIFAFILIRSSKGDTDKLFVVDLHDGIIYMAEAVDGTFVDSVQTPLPLTGLMTPVGVDFDHRTDFVYWTDEGLHTVNRAGINGIYQEIIVQVSATFGLPQGIALDLERDNVYWTDPFFETIEMANLDGSERRVVIYLEQSTIPRGIVLSQKRRKLYWTDRGPYPKIEMANLDGSKREILITDDVADPNGIALDFAEKRLYFTDTTHDFVDSVDLDNTTDRIREIFVTNNSINIFPFGVALYFEDLYFSDSSYGFIAESRANVAGIRFLNFTLVSPVEIHIYADTTCDSDYCLNAHLCKVVRRLPLTRDCFCLPGFAGHRCQDIVDACVSDPCLNGGSCLTVGEIFTCNCPVPYSGSLCETFLPCASSPCLNGGICNDDQSDSYTCSCPSGYFGDNCEQDANPCLSSPCNRGSCINHITSYLCNCLQSGGYTGDRCEILPDPCHGITCFNGGICDLGQCDCSETGFAGLYCETVPCASDPCQNGGSCFNRLQTFIFHCICPASYTGSLCETLLPCASNLCLNGATCNVDQPDSYTCSCANGYFGHNCGQESNQCLSNPCIRGSCINHITSYECNCDQSGGYTGDRCEIPPDPCEDIICLNGGICDRGQCDCSKTGYAGLYCETHTDPCLNLDTCLNGGNCTDLGTGNYLCSCPLEYTGSRCDMDVDECIAHDYPCKKNEMCTNLVGSYNCICRTDLEKINGICHAVKSIRGSLIISEVNGLPVTFTDDLRNPTSDDYSILERQCYDVLYNRIKRLLETDLWHVFIIGFSQGSIVVNFEVKIFNLNQAILIQLAEFVQTSLRDSVGDLWLSENNSVSLSVVSIHVYGITCPQHPEPPSSHIGDPKEAYYKDDLVEIICDDADSSVQWQCQENGEWNKTAMLVCDTTGPGPDIPLVPIVAVAAVAVVIIIVMLLFCVCRKKRCCPSFDQKLDARPMTFQNEFGSV